MEKLYIVNKQTRVITNIVEGDDKYDPPRGREIAKGTGKVGEIIKEPKQPAAKKAAKKSKA